MNHGCAPNNANTVWPIAALKESQGTQRCHGSLVKNCLFKVSAEDTYLYITHPFPLIGESDSYFSF